MHDAPSVSYPVGRSSWAAYALGGLWALGASATVAWMSHLPAAGWRGVLAGLACAAAGAWAAWAWWRTPEGCLDWRGSRWHWTPVQAPRADVGLQVGLDFQQVLLLRLTPVQGPSVWAWLERRSAPADWAAMRRAVYSRADPDGLPGTEPPSATP